MLRTRARQAESYEHKGQQTMSDFQNAVIKLLSSPHYKELAAYEPPFNPFEIVGATHLELIHSSVLAWLLKDEANKEFRQKFVTWIIDRVVAKAEKTEDLIKSQELQEGSITPENPENSSLKIDKAKKTKEALIELQKLWGELDVPEKPVVKTEEGDETSRYDISVYFKSLKLVIGIEVKVWAKEQDKQVERYQNLLCENYSDYKKVVVFLTPEGRKPTTADKNKVDVPVLRMSWGCVSERIREMRSALGDENNFRMQFLQHLERNIVMNEREEQRIVRELLSEGGNAETLAEIIDHESSLRGKVRELLSEGDNAKTLAKIIDNMPSLGDYSTQWKKIVAEVCGVKEENSLEVKTYTTKDGLIKELINRIPEWQNTGLIKELKIRIPEWCKAGLPFTLMLYKYQKAGVRILLHGSDLKGYEDELKEFAGRSGGVVNDKFQTVKNWEVWHPVLAEHGRDEEVEETLIGDIWSEGWKDEAKKRLREQIGDSNSGLLRQINEWIKDANKG